MERSKLCQTFWKLSLVCAIYEQSCYFLSWGPKNLKERALQFIIFCLKNMNCCCELYASMNCQMQNAAPIIRIKLTFFSNPLLCKFWVWPIVIFSPHSRLDSDLPNFECYVMSHPQAFSDAVRLRFRSCGGCIFRELAFQSLYLLYLIRVY